MPKRSSYLSSVPIAKPLAPAKLKKPNAPRRPGRPGQFAKPKGVEVRNGCWFSRRANKLRKMLTQATKRRSGPGRPTKKNSQAIARILKVARSGLPLKFAAQAKDIDSETLSQWRAKDPEFARALAEAQLQAVEERWNLIRKAAEGTADKPGDWKALAWQLERKYPSDFGRPEVQLNLAVQNDIAMNGNTGAFETIIVSDLEYLQLREQDNYEHHQGPIREVEVVKEELSGHLTRKGANGLVISQSAAEAHERRLAAIRSKSAQLLEQTPGEH